MTSNCLTLAHVLFLSLAIGCGSSHETDDAGTDTGDRDASADASDSGNDGGADTGTDAEADSGVVSCDAQDVRAVACSEFECDGPPTFHWNGDSCEPIECGACEGTDCMRGFSSLAACTSAHATCEATICRETEGTWLWWVQECLHRVCGQRTPADCELPAAVCDCGTERTFDPALGCVPDDCPEIDPLPRETLCTTTGGTWGDFCCDSICGERCGDACVAPACDCPALQIFDAAFGCVDATECYERRIGQTCAPGIARCEAGSICCEHCGGAGCFGANCQVPLCDDDELIDMCGNNALAP